MDDVRKKIPALPQTWSGLTWQQLCRVWSVKMKYRDDAYVASAAALLTLCGLTVDGKEPTDAVTGESVYRLKDKNGQLWKVTARELAYMAKTAIDWFAFPYGDQGDKEERDGQGRMVRERREGKAGYVNPEVGNWHDAMSLPVETVRIGRRRFALPQAGMYNLTWQQYRSLQAIAPQLFADGIDEATAISLQSQFLAHILAPRALALFDTNGTSIRLRPHWEFNYNSDVAERLAPWIAKRMKSEVVSAETNSSLLTLRSSLSTLFHICFQVYQTAIQFYSVVYYDLFTGGGKTDPMHTALTGEVGTINSIMKYQGYTSPQEVYDTNLPIILGVLNNMTKEAKEIEKINSMKKRKS